MTGGTVAVEWPTGTITFLFTDVVGSTGLWEADTDGTRSAMARHDTLIEDAVGECGGVVVKPRGEGDSRFAVFAEAPSAVAAALRIALALRAGPWAPATPLTLRMAVHTGTAIAQTDDYYGPDVNRAARLRSAGHAGQVLISGATAALVRNRLPPEAGLARLGWHRLRGVVALEEVFQLTHPGLPADFPLLDTGQRRHNLPAALTSFVGREGQLSELAGLLSQTRQITLLGPGGAGKTRLALEVAGRLVGDMPDGVWLAELAPIADAALVPATVGMAVGLREDARRQGAQALAEHLADKESLLVLDNCEHLVEAAAALTYDLLRAAPRLRILVTSREPLGVTGETAWVVPPLACPNPAGIASSEEGADQEAIRLFWDRARAAHPGLARTPENALAAAQICHRLDGLPLAIELAAARAAVLSLPDLARRLVDRFRVLGGGPRTAPERHRTLRAAVDWSYDGLSDEERRLFNKLSVFSGGFTLEAAEAVAAGDGGADGPDALDCLSALVGKSLVVAGERGGGTRYRLLETLRQYAAERLSGSGEESAIRTRHLTWAAALATRAASQLDGPELGNWLDRIETEHDNFRAALRWALTGPVPGPALPMAAALGRFWEVRGYLSEGRGWLESALDADPTPASPLRAKALASAGVLAQHQGDYPAARGLYEESLAMARAFAEQSITAAALHCLGNLEVLQGHSAEARSLYAGSLAIGREVAEPRIIAASLTNLGWIAQAESDFGVARRLAEESLVVWSGIGDRRGIAQSLSSLGYLALIQADYVALRRLCDESLSIQRGLGDRYGAAWSITYLGWAAQCEGDLTAARRLHDEALALRRDLGDRYGTAWSLSHLGDVARADGESAVARSWLEESLDLATALGDRHCQAWSLLRLGKLAGAEGDPRRAAGLHRQAIVLGAKVGDTRAIAEGLEGLAAQEAAQRRFDSAAGLLGAAEAVRQSHGTPLPPSERARRDADVALIVDALGRSGYEAARAAGEITSVDEALRRAIQT